MPAYDKADIQRRMTGAVDALKHDLGGLRTGRASTTLLDPVNVEVYGSHMPLSQVATVSAPEPRMLSVQVWDKSNVGPVEKAIRSAGLLTKVIASAVAEGLQARSGAGKAEAGQDGAVVEPLPEWEQALLRGEGASGSAEGSAQAASESASSGDAEEQKDTVSSGV